MGSGVEGDGTAESVEDEGETAGPSGIANGAQADSDSEPESAAAPPDDAPAVSPSAVPAAAAQGVKCSLFDQPVKVNKATQDKRVVRCKSSQTWQQLHVNTWDAAPHRRRRRLP
ncbi:transcription factor Adf-1-like [Scomber scombrus]|uniref:Transcription factor Adf-1-like n=1 Tax=Scomber scombrus TaxID=13677 RepID=A0AAV1P570_SCOSC